MRFTTDYSSSNDTYPKIGEHTKPPCTGTRFTGSAKHLVPEYTYSMDEKGEYNGAFFKNVQENDVHEIFEIYYKAKYDAGEKGVSTEWGVGSGMQDIKTDKNLILTE